MDSVAFGLQNWQPQLTGETGLAHWTDVAAVVNGQMAAQGISQRELAERSGVSPATLRKIQHGDDQARNRSTLTALSRALGLPDDHLWRIAVAGSAAAGTAEGEAGRDLGARVAELERRVDAVEERLRISGSESGQTR